MPFYRFAIIGQEPSLEEPPEWLEDDVEALKALANIATDLAQQ
jgi:hypothetical protein